MKHKQLIFMLLAALITTALSVALTGCSTGNSSGNTAGNNAGTGAVDSANAASNVNTISGENNMEIAVFETNMGNFEVQLDRAKAPITVDNFVNYVNSGFYNGTVFHRVIPGFMAQCGGFTPDGNQKPTNAPIKLESGNGLSNLRGTVAMARTSIPDSATSQFFINVVDNQFLDKSAQSDGYAVFGKVISGMDVADKIVQVKTTTKNVYAKDWPVIDIVITKAYMKK
jgi:peptidyl-prolyl cis-trans isomerase A (cyclophilin A)